MKWLQGTFATRFNRFHGERGHVFQGRYKSLVVEEDRPLLGLIDYIHLNPVRAELCSVDGLGDYALSSFPKYRKRKVFPPLDRGTVLSLCDLPNTLAGMRKYHERLKTLEEGEPRKRGELSKRYCRGWFLGKQAGEKGIGRGTGENDPDGGLGRSGLEGIERDPLGGNRRRGTQEPEAGGGGHPVESEGSGLESGNRQASEERDNGQKSMDRRPIENGASELCEQSGSSLKSLDFAFDPFSIPFRWEAIVAEELKSRKLGEADLRSSPKGAVWKVEIARRLRKETTAKNPWIAARLKMGHPNYVSNLVHRSNL